MCHAACSLSLLCSLASLGVGESLCVSLGVNFNDTTNPAKFDIRLDTFKAHFLLYSQLLFHSTKTGKFPVQIDARVGELVRGVVMTESSFLSMQGSPPTFLLFSIVYNLQK